MVCNSHTAASIHFSDGGGGGGQKLVRNIKLKLCMFSGISMLNLMV